MVFLTAVREEAAAGNVSNILFQTLRRDNLCVHVFGQYAPCKQTTFGMCEFYFLREGSSIVFSIASRLLT